MLNTEFEIAGRRIGAAHPPYVIAEAGSNFNQSLDVARRLVDAAADAGADAVKFQLFRADALYPGGGEMHDIFKSIELDPAWVPQLAEHCVQRGIHFFASAFDAGSVQVLIDAKVPAMKIASSETTNLSLVAQMAAAGVPLIISTGMCDMVDVEEAAALCEGIGNRDIAFLQCGAMYPLPPELVNLRVMRTFASRFGCPVGFSDHTLQANTGAIAVGAGASVLEKHFTLDRASPGPDHFYALEPHELKDYVTGARDAHIMLGHAIKEMLPEERRLGRREGLHAARELPAGHRLTAEDIAVRRPAVGIRSRDLSAVVGARLKGALADGEPLAWDNLAFTGPSA